jgi:hypothetical protein
MRWKSFSNGFCATGWNGSCEHDGRMRYNHDRRLWARGAVNAVPLICSAYRPYLLSTLVAFGPFGIDASKVRAAPAESNNEKRNNKREGGKQPPLTATIQLVKTTTAAATAARVTSDARALLRVVLPHGQRARQCLGRELVVEAAHVFELAGGPPLSPSAANSSIDCAGAAAAAVGRLPAGTLGVGHCADGLAWGTTASKAFGEEKIENWALTAVAPAPAAALLDGYFTNRASRVL